MNNWKVTKANFGFVISKSVLVNEKIVIESTRHITSFDLNIFNFQVPFENALNEIEKEISEALKNQV